MRSVLCMGLLSACLFSGEPSDESTAVLAVMVQPEATITLNGRDEGRVSIRNFEGLEPGSYEIRLTAEGYEPFATTLTLVPGETARVQQELSALATEPKPEPKPETDASEPTMSFTTTPSGAEVTVNGDVLGTTPITGWVPTNENLDIAITLEGYEPYSTTLPEPIAAFEATLTALPAKKVRKRTVKKSKSPGFVSIGIVGGGWGHVYLNGTKLKKTAPLAKFEVPAGPHTIRVVNEGNGLDWSRDVVVEPGKLMKLAAKPQ